MVNEVCSLESVLPAQGQVIWTWKKQFAKGVSLMNLMDPQIDLS
jgi:hypothetical protein